MSKGHMLKTLVTDCITAVAKDVFKALESILKEKVDAFKSLSFEASVKERLAAAAEEIYELFGSTVKEYEDELRKAKLETQKKQRLLDYLCPRVQATQKIQTPATPSGPDPRPDVNQEDTKTSQVKVEIKEEPEEQCTKQEEERLPVSTPESSTACVKAKESLLLQPGKTEPQEETPTSSGPHFVLQTEGQASHPSETHDYGNKGSLFSCATEQIEDDGNHSNQDQIRDRKTEKSGLSIVDRFKKAMDGKIYSCSICDRQFSTKRRRYLHIEAFHTEHNPFSCSYCKKEFSSRQVRFVHERIHTGEKPYKCIICTKSFALNHHLVIHQRTHTGGNPYKCLVCNKTYADDKGYHSHMKLHTGKGLYGCTVCKKKIPLKRTLQLHMRVHTGEKPFTCTLCNSTFRYKCGLTRHFGIIHASQKPSSASVSKKTLAATGSQRVLTEECTKKKRFSCSICRKTFKEKGGLNNHMWLHTKEKHFSCPICQKKFQQKSSRFVHMKIHSGEKPFSCTVCMRAFTYKSTLKAHMITHTTERPKIMLHYTSTCEEETA